MFRDYFTMLSYDTMFTLSLTGFMLLIFSSVTSIATCVVILTDGDNIFEEVKNMFDFSDSDYRVGRYLILYPFIIGSLLLLTFGIDCGC